MQSDDVLNISEQDNAAGDLDSSRMGPLKKWPSVSAEELATEQNDAMELFLERADKFEDNKAANKCIGLGNQPESRPSSEMQLHEEREPSIDGLDTSELDQNMNEQAANPAASDDYGAPEEEEPFMERLNAFFASRNEYLATPKFNREPLDLAVLWDQVQMHGGFEQVSYLFLQ